MHHTYLPGTYIPELNGKADGAVSVVCHHPLDLECVYAVAELAPRPPGSPLASIASALSQPNSWEAWRDHWRNQGGYMPDPDRPPPDSLQKTIVDERQEAVESDAENLRLVLAGLYHIWLAQEAMAGPEGRGWPSATTRPGGQLDWRIALVLLTLNKRGSN